MKEVFNILSPDNIDISIEHFNSENEALSYFLIWIERFKEQGYYSSNKGRIKLNEIFSFCKVVKYEIEEENFEIDDKPF